MTLGAGIDILRSRFGVDNDCDFDIEDDDMATSALMVAAQVVSRDTYFLFTARADLTLTAGQAEIDLLDAAQCALRVFHVRGVNINDNWLHELTWQEVESARPDYYKATSSDRPSEFTEIAPGKLLLLNPPSLAAENAAHNFVTGWYEHPIYDFGDDEDTELLGPTAFHDLIVDRAYIDNSKSYIAGMEGYERRETVKLEYYDKAKIYRAENLGKYAKRQVQRGGGRGRAYFGIGRNN